MTEISFVIDLKQEGLRHAPGAVDGCKGTHTVVAELPEDSELHTPEDCGTPPYATENEIRALQELHESAHPHGTLFAAYCREQPCAQLNSQTW